MPRDSVLDLMIRIACCPLATEEQQARAEWLAFELGGHDAMLAVYIRRGAA